MPDELEEETETGVKRKNWAWIVVTIFAALLFLALVLFFIPRSR